MAKPKQKRTTRQPVETHQITLTGRELANIVAALRLARTTWDYRETWPDMFFSKHDPLEPEEIDTLAQRLTIE